MFDPEDLPLTTTDGHRPSSTAGDRMMVGLAALALFGGALIAIGKVLPQNESPTTSVATPTVEPTEVASRTPRPTPTPPALRSFQVEPGTPPEPQPQQPGYSGWVRALEDVSIHSAADAESTERAVLLEGDAAWVEIVPEDQGGEPGWFQVQVPMTGWVQPEIDGRSVLRTFPWPGYHGGWIDGLASGPEGFAFIGYSPPVGGRSQRFLATSGDGRSWQKDDFFMRGFYGAFIASGPAGWLALGYPDDGYGDPWLWQSADGAEWEPLGSVPPTAGQNGGIGQLVANESGYILMTFGDGGYGRDRPSLWYSTDGVLWSERRAPDGFTGSYGLHIAATPLGFVLYTSPEFGPMSPEDFQAPAFSPDGWTWSTVASDQELQTLVGVAAAGDEIVAIERIDTGRMRAWVGTITGEEMTWTPDRGAGSAFDGAVVTAVVSDGTTPVAFGWERFTDNPLWWSRSGDSWQRHRLPEDYHGIPRIAAAGPAGYLLVGNSPSILADNPTLWTLSSSGVWQLQAAALIAPVDAPTDADCAALSDDFIDVMRNVRMRIACFGDAPVTFRAYSWDCVDCYNEYRGSAEPGWLVRPNADNVLNLLPAEVDGWESMGAVLPPSLDLDPDWIGSWLVVTGHFDDPRAASCTRSPPPDEEVWYGGRDSVIQECRNRFVVTRVRVAT